MNKKIICSLFAFLFFVSISNSLHSLDFSVQYLPGDKFKITEKADLRRYENGRFIGLSYREVRGVLEVEADRKSNRIHGDYYVFEETKHNKRNVARRIDDVVPVSFSISSNGVYTVSDSEQYPTLRSFPTFPNDTLEVGDTWRDFGVRVVEPFLDGKFTRVRFYCEYRYEGKQIKYGQAHEVIRAQYAMRYKQGEDPYGDERIKRISGKHVVNIYYNSSEQRPSFMSDNMEEQYQLEDGKTIALKGFILTWFDMINLMDRTKLADKIKNTLKETGIEDVDVEERSDGVALTLNKIHFVADQAVVLPQEKNRLKKLAEALKKIPNRSFLVVGHTARIGTEESQYTLSVERAKAIVDYLTAQGIKAERFLYEGKGGTMPVAPNDKEENMAKNRRVEIIILED